MIAPRRAVLALALTLPATASAQGFSASRYLMPPSGEDLALTERALLGDADDPTSVQHGAALPVYFEAAGKVMLGLRPTEPGW